MRSIAALLIIGVVASASLFAQGKTIRERARAQNQLGWEDMRAEAWEKAARSFQNAIDIDHEFEIAHYGLGRANMALKKFDAAIAAYERCRGLYRAQAGRIFTNAQEAQRYRRDRILEIDEQLRMMQSGPMTAGRADTVRQLQNQRRDIQESIQRGDNMTIESTVPAYVSLALGSAYFRAGRLSDAEREYKATLASDNRAGEAHSNLAVVYFETGRFAEAATSLQAAKKAGFKVNPELERAIRDKSK
jgi:tetratricopeptide (TPR) repeat protein